MAYQCQNFRDGQVLTAECLNKIEKALEGVCDKEVANVYINDQSELVLVFADGTSMNGGKVAGGGTNAVLYTEQTLTEEQKAQARENIGVVDSDVRTDTFESGDVATVANVSSLILHGKSVEKPGKNLCSLGSVGFTQTAEFDISEIPAGIYSASCEVESTDTDSNFCVMAFLSASGATVYSAAFERVETGRSSVNYFQFTQPVTKVRVYSSSSWDTSSGDTAIFKDVQVEAGTSATEYQPYGAITDGIDAVVSFGEEVFSADTILFDGDTLDFATSELRKNDGSSSVVAVSGNVSTLNGTYKITAPNKVTVTHKHLPYVLFDPQALTIEQKAQARENIGAMPQEALDVLGIEPILSNNLFNKDAVTETGQWVKYNSGQREFYPTNQYIANYFTSDNIPVIGGKTYVYSGGSKAHAGYTDFISYAIFTKEDQYIVGKHLAYVGVEPYKIDMPENAGYIVINMTIGLNIDTIQFELGEDATTYQPYGANGFVLNNVKVRHNQITFDDTSLLQLPKQYNLVVGDTFELFYKGIMLCKDPYAYNILVTCPVGNAYRKKYVFTPTEAGTHTLNIRVTDDFENVLDEKSVQLVVSAKMSSPASNINVLCFGDSLTAGGNWVDEVYRRLTKTSSVTQHNAAAPTGDGLSNITFVGKKTTANGAKYEGTGGWRYSDYLDVNKDGNPFVYNGKVDFTAYCSALNINKIDQCYILLGWNMSWMTETAWKADAKAMLDLLIAHNSAIKITLIGIQIPAHDGLGTNYGANGGLADYRAMQKYVFNVDKWNNTIAADYPNNVTSISIAGQFDTENNMPTATTTPNIRSTAQIKQQNNGLHPENSGYYQIADAVYRKFVADNG